MTTRIESLGLIVATLRRVAQNEPLAECGSDELSALLAATKRTVESADSEDLAGLGRAALHLTLEVLGAHLQAEKAATLAQLVAQSGKADDRGLQ